MATKLRGEWMIRSLENHPKLVLTEAEQRRLREAYADGVTYRDLQSRFRVSSLTIRRVVSGSYDGARQSAESDPS